MAKEHGIAGEWARVKGTVLGLWPLFLGLLALGFFAALTYFVSFAWGGLAFLLTVVFLCWCFARGLNHIERFYKGARGEERVAQLLRELPDRYHIFNDFVAEGHHVDHVVVGPAGVFAVETKNWSGNVTIEDNHILVSGELPSRPPLTQVLHEATHVKNELARLGWKGTVTPVLAFASDTFYAHRAEIKGVVILNSCELITAFETERVVMPPAELERLVSLMETKA